jgi:hypothetical protein
LPQPPQPDHQEKQAMGNEMQALIEYAPLLLAALLWVWSGV